MPLFDDPPLHDFLDRAIRRMLEDPRNLHDLMGDRRNKSGRRYFWRHREAKRTWPFKRRYAR